MRKTCRTAESPVKATTILSRAHWAMAVSALAMSTSVAMAYPLAVQTGAHLVMGNLNAG